MAMFARSLFCFQHSVGSKRPLLCEHSGFLARLASPAMANSTTVSRGNVGKDMLDGVRPAITTVYVAGLISPDGQLIENTVWTYETPFPAVAEIKAALAVYTSRVDAVEVGWGLASPQAGAGAPADKPKRHRRIG